MKVNQLQNTGLRYFLEVVRCGSISEAANRLNVAPSAISRQIACLESILETVLFERHARGMIPSAAGELLAAHTKKVAFDSERVLSEINSLKGLRGGFIRIAATEGFAIDFLPRLMAEFQADYQSVQFQLVVRNAAGVRRAVREGEVDFGVAYSRVPEKDIQVLYEQTAPMFVVVRTGHPLARFRQLALSQLQDSRVVLPEQDSTARQLFDIASSQQKLNFEPLLTCNFLASLWNFVLFSNCVMLSSEITCRYRVLQGELAAIPLRDKVLSGRRVEVISLIGRKFSKVTEVFLDKLKRELPPPPRP